MNMTEIAGQYVTSIQMSVVRDIKTHFMLLQGSPHNILRYLIVGLLQVNEHHMQVLPLLPISLHKLLYQEDGFQLTSQA